MHGTTLDSLMHTDCISINTRHMTEQAIPQLRHDDTKLTDACSVDCSSNSLSSSSICTDITNKTGDTEHLPPPTYPSPLSLVYSFILAPQPSSLSALTILTVSEPLTFITSPTALTHHSHTFISSQPSPLHSPSPSHPSPPWDGRRTHLH